MDISRLQRKLRRKWGDSLSVRTEDRSIIVSGHLKSWSDIVEACSLCVQKDREWHVVNDIVLDGVTVPEPRMPSVRDGKLEGRTPDVLIIGGGVSGCSIARELTKWKLDVLLVEKEADVAMQASGRNDGEVHPGVDLGKGSLKQHYVLLGNRAYDKVCRELDVPFRRCGQYVGFTNPWTRPFVELYAWQRKHICGVTDTKVIGRKELLRAEPNLSEDIRFAMWNPSAGCVCPYGLTIAFAENAVKNGAEISLETAVTGMEVEDGMIVSVTTNRGTVRPKIVINAAGVFSEDVARMAGDRFFSIHPRKGTDIIMDRKKGGAVKSIATIKDLSGTKGHTKGGGILHTVHDNLLLGPDAVETYLKEDWTTSRENVDAVIKKQQRCTDGFSGGDVITYFSGVRAATFEEDFIIEKGRKTHNLIHAAGIQSPGLTTAPVVAKDIERMAVEMLTGMGVNVEENPSWDPVRKGIPQVKSLPDDVRNALIREDPDYGVIVCRCEEISRGEILDALRSPLSVPTVDAVKRRVRPGMGRCQGGFCMPLVTKIIHEETGIPMEEIRKASGDSNLVFGETKEADDEDL